jgi:hypothetical protein
MSTSEWSVPARTAGQATDAASVQIHLPRLVEGQAEVRWHPAHREQWLENAGGYLQYKFVMRRSDRSFGLQAKDQPEVPR